MTRFAFKTPLQFLALFGMRRWRRRFNIRSESDDTRVCNKKHSTWHKNERAKSLLPLDIGGEENLSTVMATLGMNRNGTWTRTKL